MTQSHIPARVVSGLACSCALALAGCGGNSPGGPNTTHATGYFIDSAVQGLNYEAGSRSGVTDALGTFEYDSGSLARFSIGDLELGEGTPAVIMTPVELASSATDEQSPTAVNICRLLMTLDEDGDPANGLLITAAVRGAAAGISLVFQQDTNAFEHDPDVVQAVSTLTALTTAGLRTLTPAATAQDHLRRTLLAILAGEYSGSYSGGDTGTWSIHVDTNGSISGSGQGTHAGSFTITGTAQSSGQMDFVTGSVSVEADFWGAILRDGSVSGSWATTSEPYVEGTFSGHKEGSVGPPPPAAGGHIVFRTGGWGEIHMIGGDGTNEVNLTNSTYHEDEPVFSPDGQTIAYLSDHTGSGRLEIFLMARDGSNVRQLTHSPDYTKERLAYVADGTRVAYSPFAGTPVRVVSLVDSTETSWSLTPSLPAFAASGTRIAWVQAGIWTANADGTDPVQLTSDPTDEAPAVSPDGTRIAFDSMRQCADPNAWYYYNTEIYIMDANGQNVTRLTFSDPSLDHDFNSVDENPCFSPDGTHLVYFSRQGGSAGIWTMTITGQNRCRLTAGSSPSWGP